MRPKFQATSLVNITVNSRN